MYLITFVIDTHAHFNTCYTQVFVAKEQVDMTMMRLQTSERSWRIYTDKHILSRCSRGSRWDDLIPLGTRIKCSGFISSCKSSHQDQWRLLFSWTHTDCRLPSFLPPPPPLLSLFQADLIWSAVSVPLSFAADSSSLRPLYLLGVLSAPPPRSPLGSGWAADPPPPVRHAVSDGEQLDEVWTCRPGLSGLVAWTLGSALHRQTGDSESIFKIHLLICQMFDGIMNSNMTHFCSILLNEGTKIVHKDKQSLSEVNVSFYFSLTESSRIQCLKYLFLMLVQKQRLYFISLCLFLLKQLLIIINNHCFCGNG